jgi:tRNA pseudouridine55 synthase
VASGILNVVKPVGPTSFAIVRGLKRLPGVQKIGHGGTLDPAAEGVLPILVNAATRLAEFVHAWPKTYRAAVTFGKVSDTGDRDGAVSPAGDASALTAEQIQAVLPAFTGRIEQVPPVYSALKQGGEPLYRKARRGQAVAVPPRAVQIDAITLQAFDAASSTARLEVRCHSGTYIRSLASDLGQTVGCGAYLSSLTRIAVGPLTIDAALEPERLVAMGERWTDWLLPLDLPLQTWPAITLPSTQKDAVRHGMSLAAPESPVPRYRLLDERGQLVAWAELKDGRLQPRAVFEP